MKKAKIFLSVVLAMIMAFSFVSVAFAADSIVEKEPNNDAEYATDLGKVAKTEVKASANVDMSTADYFKVVTESAGNLSVKLARPVVGNVSGFKVEILDSSCGKITEFTVSTSAESGNAKPSVPAGTFYIKVTGEGDVFGEVYTISVVLTEASANSESEPNDTFDKANEVTLAKSSDILSKSAAISGTVISGDKDIFTFSVKNLNAYVFATIKNSTNGTLVVKTYAEYGRNPKKQGEVNRVEIASGATVTTEYLYVEVGTCYYEISGLNSATGDYTITMYEQKSDTASIETEYNDAYTEADVIRVTGDSYSFYGNTVWDEDWDFYKVSLGKDENYTFTAKGLTNDGGRWNIEIFTITDNVMSAKANGTFSYSSEYTCDLKEKLGAESGTVYIKVSSNTFSAADYKFSFAKKANPSSGNGKTDWSSIFDSAGSYFNTFWKQVEELLGKLDLLTMITKIITSLTKFFINISV